MSLMDGVKAVIFDLDGTLYQDEIVCFDLIRYYAAGTPYETLAEEIVAYAREVLAGKKNLKCGHFVKKETVSGPVSVANLFDFPSVRGLACDHPELYFDRSVYSYIGDSWTLAMFLGHRLGFYEKEFWNRFSKARQQLLSGPGRQKEDERISRMLKKLRAAGVLLALYTTSTYNNSNCLIKNLGLLDKFDELAHGVNKPYGLGDRIEMLRKNYSLRYEEILLVGDQGYSDLMVGRGVGTRTLLVNPNLVDDGMDWSVRVNSLEELTEVLTVGQLSIDSNK